MRINLLIKNKQIGLALLLASVLHLFLFFLFSLIYLKNNSGTTRDVVFISYKTFEKPKDTKFNYKKRLTQKPAKRKNEKNIIYDENVITSESNIFTIDTSFVENSDSVNHFADFSDSINIFDSFVLQNPNLVVLKLALEQNIRNKVISKSEAEIAVNRLNKYMIDYYKLKYPTPLSKFGNPGGGSMISIPIDDVIELFK